MEVSTSISDRLIQDLKTAMKAGDTDRRDVVRLLRSAFKNRQIELQRELEADDEVEVVQAQIKQRRDSIDAYEKAGREDLAGKERLELDILLTYLPNDLKPLEADELERVVVAKIDELGLTGPADMRTLMPAVIEATGGRADNRLVSQLASAALRRRAESVESPTS